MRRVIVTLGFWAALLLAAPFRATAHDIPADVTVQAFLKPEGQKLRLLIRVPLKAMRDIDFPLRGPGFLDLSKVDPLLPDAAKLWIAGAIELYEGERKLADARIAESRLSLISDRSFGSYEEALAHVTGTRLAPSTDLFWNQAMLDVLFEYPIRSDRSDFSIRPGLARLGSQVSTVLRFMPAGGEIRGYEFHGDPGLLRLDPRWHQAALLFVKSGFLHILDGVDHLLFLFCLVIPLRRFRTLLVVVSSFTVAHSITLIASAYNLGPDALWFPPLIEVLIAASIVWMAFENIVAGGGAKSVDRRWIITFGFGLVHGFGFSFALRETLQFAGSHLLVSLLAFNVGVELGQILVLVALISALAFVFRFVVAERMGTIILSALVAHTGWHWMTERWDALRQYSFAWPALTATLLASALRWLLVIVVLAALVWLVSGVRRQWAGQPRRPVDVDD